MSTPSNLLPLKVIVISLGIVLFGGFIWIVTTVIHRANSELSAMTCHQDATAHLQTQGKILSAMPVGTLVQVTLSLPTETQVITLDQCTGKTLHVLKITP